MRAAVRVHFGRWIIKAQRHGAKRSRPARNPLNRIQLRRQETARSHFMRSALGESAQSVSKRLKLCSFGRKKESEGGMEELFSLIKRFLDWPGLRGSIRLIAGRRGAAVESGLKSSVLCKNQCSRAATVQQCCGIVKCVSFMYAYVFCLWLKK